MKPEPFQGMTHKSRSLATIANLFDMPKPRADKCHSLYNLAKSAKAPGVILELGTYHGCGALALYFGTQAGGRLQVVTVDDYEEKQGWAGEPYGAADEFTAVQNFINAGVPKPEIFMWKAECNAAAKGFPHIVSLFWWDLGCANRIEFDVIAWRRRFRDGTLVALHDTADGRLGAKLAMTALGIPDDRIKILDGGIWFAEYYS